MLVFPTTYGVLGCGAGAAAAGRGVMVLCVAGCVLGCGEALV